MAKRLEAAGGGRSPEPPGGVEPAAAVRRNPDFFGIDVERVAFGAVGLAATAAVNDALVYPFISNLVKVSGTAGKLLDAATTFGTALGLGKVFGMVGFRAAGRDMELGGQFLGAGKVISVPFPAFSISAKFPAIPGVATQQAATNQVQAANGKVISFPDKTAPGGQNVQVLASAVPDAQYIGF